MTWSVGRLMPGFGKKAINDGVEMVASGISSENGSPTNV
jgi:hypothetical protein